MATKVTVFKAEDGTLFNSFAEASTHDKTAKRGMNLDALFAEMGRGESNGYNEFLSDVRDLLLKNADAVITALNVKVAETRGRKAKTEATGTTA